MLSTLPKRQNLPRLSFLCLITSRTKVCLTLTHSLGNKLRPILALFLNLKRTLNLHCSAHRPPCLQTQYPSLSLLQHPFAKSYSTQRRSQNC